MLADPDIGSLRPAVPGPPAGQAASETRTDLSALRTLVVPALQTPPDDAAPPAAPPRYEFWKPVADFLAALVLLALASPVLVVCALLVRSTSRGPALYSQVRLGRG